MSSLYIIPFKQTELVFIINYAQKTLQTSQWFLRNIVLARAAEKLWLKDKDEQKKTIASFGKL